MRTMEKREQKWEHLRNQVRKRMQAQGEMPHKRGKIPGKPIEKAMMLQQREEEEEEWERVNELPGLKEESEEREKENGEGFEGEDGPSSKKRKRSNEEDVIDYVTSIVTNCNSSLTNSKKKPLALSHETQWSRSTKNPDVSTGRLAYPFTRSLAQLTRLLAPPCLLHSHARL